MGNGFKVKTVRDINNGPVKPKRDVFSIKTAIKTLRGHKAEIESVNKGKVPGK